MDNIISEVFKGAKSHRLNAPLASQERKDEEDGGEKFPMVEVGRQSMLERDIRTVSDLLWQLIPDAQSSH